MTRTFQIDELDDASRDYLLTIRRSQGVGQPGIYVAGSGALAWWGFFLGIGTIVGTLWLTLPPLGPPLNTAMLQTAGLVLGGWMLVAAFRVWLGGSRLGNFVFADAQRLWEANGTQVRVADLIHLLSFQCQDNYSNDAYTGSTFTLHFNGGGKANFTVTDGTGAERLNNYLTILVNSRTAQEGGPEPIAAANLGHVALALADGDPTELPLTGRMPNVSDAVEPPTPVSARRPRSGLVAYLAIVAMMVAGVFTLERVNVVLGDDAWFDLVKNMDPPDLRFYLLDPAKTRNRDKVKELLAASYEPVLAKIKAAPNPEPKLRDEYLELIRGLQTALEPHVSVKVTEEPVAGGAGEFEAQQAKVRLEDLKRRLCQTQWNAFQGFRNGRMIDGMKMVDFVEPPAQAKPMLEIAYRFEQNADGTKMTWTVAVRRNATTDNAETVTWTITRPHPFGHGVRELVDEGMQRTLNALIGTTQVNPAGALAPPVFQQ